MQYQTGGTQFGGWWIVAIIASVLNGSGAGCSCDSPTAVDADAALDASRDAAVDVAFDAPLAPHITYVKASNTAKGDLFGWSAVISSDGNTVAVGATAEASGATGINGDQASNTSGYAGAVYIYVRSGATWVQQAYIKASNTGATYEFGWSVALSADGNTLAVGSVGEHGASTGINHSEADANNGQAGAAYVFERSGNVWMQQAYVKASNAGFGDRFGESVALSSDGNTLAVGAVFESSDAVSVDGSQQNDNATNSGAVYVYARTGRLWTQQAYVKASNTEPGDGFGTSLSLSGDGKTLAVGATGESSGIFGSQADNSAQGAGAVYIYRRHTGDQWAQDAFLKAPYPSADDLFGLSLSLSESGSVLAVGCAFEDSIARGVNGDSQDDSSSNSGAVFVFERDASTWAQHAYLKSSNDESDDYFGWAVSLTRSGDGLAVGARSESSASQGYGGDLTNNGAPGAGAAYIFRRSGTAWSETQYLKATNTTAGLGGFGSQVSISGDGAAVLAISAGEASLSTGTNGAQTQSVNGGLNAGAAYILE